MNMALKEAERALENGEVPIGAIIVANDTIIARGHNQTEQLTDCTAHAEMIAMTSAFAALNNKYLKDCTLYVTLEPCPMCAGALRWSQISKIVYGASDEKAGYTKYAPQVLHPKTTVIKGIEEDKCGNMLTEFFRSKRK